MKTQLFTFAIYIMASLSLSAQQGISIGDKVPLFKATADDGSVWNISNFIGKDYIVVYFYPGAMTGGCTKQACSYRDHRNDLESADAIVVGISGDKVENLKLFRQVENLNFPLVSDEKGEIAGKFGVPVSEGTTIKRVVEGSEHELVRGVTAKRWTFIVGKDSRIIYKNESVNAEKDTEEVLNFLKEQG